MIQDASMLVLCISTSKWVLCIFAGWRPLFPIFFLHKWLNTKKMISKACEEPIRWLKFTAGLAQLSMKWKVKHVKNKNKMKSKFDKLNLTYNITACFRLHFWNYFLPGNTFTFGRGVSYLECFFTGYFYCEPNQTRPFYNRLCHK